MDQDTGICSKEINMMQEQTDRVAAEPKPEVKKRKWDMLLDSFLSMSYILYLQALNRNNTLEFTEFARGPLFDMPLSKINIARLKAQDSYIPGV